MWQISEMNDNLRKYAQLKGLTKGTGLALSKLTGIDKSTVSLHLTGHRKMSLEHAKKYADSLEVPIIKLIDDKSIKYPVVGYVQDDGSVRMRDENEIEVLVTDNHIQSNGNYCLVHKKQQLAYFYNPKISCKNTEIDGDYCYIKTKKGNYLGDLKPSKKKLETITNRHSMKTIRLVVDVYYPILSFHSLKHTDLYKIQGEY